MREMYTATKSSALFRRKNYLYRMAGKLLGYIFLGKHNCDRRCVAYIFISFIYNTTSAILSYWCSPFQQTCGGMTSCNKKPTNAFGTATYSCVAAQEKSACGG
jgi:hypothetical protein